MQEGHTVAAGDRAQVGMIADHHGDFGVEFAGLLALQKIFQAMRQARGKQCDLRNVAAEVEFELHCELLGPADEIAPAI